MATDIRTVTPTLNGIRLALWFIRSFFEDILSSIKLAFPIVLKFHFRISVFNYYIKLIAFNSSIN